MSVNGMADRSLQLLDRVEELARKNGYNEMPLEFSIARVRALLQLPEPQKAHGRDEAKRLLDSTLNSAQSNGVRGAECRKASQPGWPIGAGRARFRRRRTVVQESRRDIQSSGFTEGRKRTASCTYRSCTVPSHSPAKAVLAINRGMEVLQPVEEAYDFPALRRGEKLRWKLLWEI